MISKHLMLKFIHNSDKYPYLILQFQNILCWSLSFLFCHAFGYIFLFQNILCWSLSQNSAVQALWNNQISKHLMLKFIPHFLVTFISFYLFSPSFFLISIIFTKHQPIFFFLSNISQIPRLYNTFSTFFFFSPGKYFYNSQSGMGCSSDVFTTENAWS